MNFKLHYDLSDNYTEIKKEYEQAVKSYLDMDYKGFLNIYQGEWTGLGIKTAWGEWTEQADNFPILKEILSSSEPNIKLCSFQRMGPHTEVDWHDGKLFRNIAKRVQKLYSDSHSNLGSYNVKQKGNEYLAIRNHFTIDSKCNDHELMGMEVKETGEKFSWKNGECFSFCDYLTHRAWNRTDEYRVILLFDYELSNV